MIFVADGRAAATSMTATMPSRAGAVEVSEAVVIGGRNKKP